MGYGSRIGQDIRIGLLGIAAAAGLDLSAVSAKDWCKSGHVRFLESGGRYNVVFDGMKSLRLRTYDGIHIIFLSALFLLFPSLAVAQDPSLPKPCALYLEYVGAEHTLDEVSDTCIPFEKMIIEAGDWRSFVWNFERSFSEDAYPVQLEAALSALADGRPGLALVHFDFGMSSVSQVFQESGDRERGELYIFLFQNARNVVFHGYDIPNSFWEEFEAVSVPGPLLAFPKNEFKNLGFLKCLIRYDAWTPELSSVLGSSVFNSCVQTEVSVSWAD